MARSVRTLTTLGILALASAGCTTPGDAGDGAPRLGRADGPRNVILFLGDGMGVSTITAARIYAGQMEGGPGEDHVLSFERFPNVALVKTYNTDAQVADSAGTASALMTGEKTRIGHISVAADVPHGDCAAALDGSLPTLLEQAEDQGFATGVVSTARITHATPAATYAHVPDRDWESDAQLPAGAAEAGCRDIARQLVEFDHGDGIDVMLGGGRTAFLPAGVADPEYPDKAGGRADGRNLIDAWTEAYPTGRYVWNQTGFEGLEAGGDGPVLGLFEPSHMQYEADRAGDAAGEPSLADMTRFAIGRLQHNPNGFFLMVEGGRIDHGHHAGNAYRALEDTVAMAEAVEVARLMTNAEDTLIVVTADHSHTFTISGYPKRGNPILGKVEGPGGTEVLDSEGRPYTTVGYMNGPGYREELPDLTDVDTTDPSYRQVAGYPLTSETHGGEDVAAFAHGLNATAVYGVMEQNRLFDVMQMALLGDADSIDAGGR